MCCSWWGWTQALIAGGSMDGTADLGLCFYTKKNGCFNSPSLCPVPLHVHYCSCWQVNGEKQWWIWILTSTLSVKPLLSDDYSCRCLSSFHLHLSLMGILFERGPSGCEWHIWTFCVKEDQRQKKTNSRDTDLGQGKGDTSNCIRPSQSLDTTITVESNKVHVGDIAECDCYPGIHLILHF